MRLQEAAGHGLSHAEFLELILQDELAVRSDRQLQRRRQGRLFRELKTLDDFDWSFNPSIKKKQVFDLATCRFVRETPRRALAGAAGRGQESSWCRPSATRRSRRASLVLYRSIFDVVRDFLHDEAVRRRGQGAGPVPQARPADHRRHGHEAIAASVRANICSRSSCAATRRARR